MPFDKCYRVAAVVLLMTGAVVGCKKSSEEVFLTRAQELRQRAAPAGSTTSEPAAIVHSGMAMDTEWQLRCPLSESACRTLLSKQLELEFSKLRSTPQQIVYGRFAGGDSERLEVIVVKRDGNITQYTVRFRAMPG